MLKYTVCILGVINNWCTVDSSVVCAADMFDLRKVGYCIKNKVKNGTRNAKAFSNTTLGCKGGQILWVLNVPNISTSCHFNSQPVRVREPPPPSPSYTLCFSL